MTPEQWYEMNEVRLIGTGNANHLPPFSNRHNCFQVIAPITASRDLARTVNGKLLDLSQEQFRLYRTTITGDDAAPAALDGIFPGAEFEVWCKRMFWFPTATGEASRPAVEGSVRVRDDGFTYYQPILQMRVSDWEIGRNNYQNRLTWRIDLEEIEPLEAETS